VSAWNLYAVFVEVAAFGTMVAGHTVGSAAHGGALKRGDADLVVLVCEPARLADARRFAGGR
jgi:hypothetical protein